MIHPLLGALLLLGAATVHAQGAPAGSHEPAYSVEWNEKNR
ncbi:hypothetical protein [Arenimonas composti]|uniref:Uncharacterized protein n=1 Tax=Arenimonas composti TR7-09 = DSM 18010 TaxID=1121013 RepID=A0A091BGI1_9GAMM|nr:hypothetical protein [Arenimonas composti]KFN49904.1 hypothetical protein P873_08660 [Arenimonas composti TR7-09 = DSM 18010]